MPAAVAEAQLEDFEMILAQGAEMPFEDAGAWDAMHLAFRAEFQPRTAYQRTQVAHMVDVERDIRALCRKRAGLLREGVAFAAEKVLSDYPNIYSDGGWSEAVWALLDPGSPDHAVALQRLSQKRVTTDELLGREFRRHQKPLDMIDAQIARADTRRSKLLREYRELASALEGVEEAEVIGGGSGSQ